MRLPSRSRLMLLLFLTAFVAVGSIAWRAWAAKPGAVNAEAFRVLINFAAGKQGAEANSGNNRQFAQWLKQFPLGDADSDGVLTQPEALAFVDLLDSMQTIEVHKDLEYRKIDGESIKLDVYLPTGFTTDDAKKYPAVLYIHGGGWSRGSKSDTPQVMQLLAANGYVVASIDYRLAPKHKFPAQIDDSRAALEWLAAHAEEYHIDKERLAVMGGSAGGHLSLLVGLMDRKSAEDSEELPPVRAVVNLFGPTDLTTGDWPERADGILAKFLGGTLSEQPQRYKIASPVTYIDRLDPPVLTLHGTKDPLVPFNQAEILHKQLTDAGVKSHLEPVEGGGHGWGEPDLSRTLRLTLSFLEENVKGK